jgi:protein-tyrosine phosphatase
MTVSVRAGSVQRGDVRRAEAGPLPGGGPGYDYTPHVHFLFVCTANICRSPMAAALFAEQIEHLAGPVEVSSAGISATGQLADRAVPHEVLEVMAPYGIDLSAHRSQVLTQPMLEGADLIIGMSRRHVQEAVLMDPPSWPKSFMLKELVRRGAELGPRRADQGFRSWIDLVHGDRTRQSLAQRSPVDDIEDPYGRPLAAYRSTAHELAELTAGLALLLWPDGAVRLDATAD